MVITVCSRARRKHYHRDRAHERGIDAHWVRNPEPADVRLCPPGSDRQPLPIGQRPHNTATAEGCMQGHHRRDRLPGCRRPDTRRTRSGAIVSPTRARRESGDTWSSLTAPFCLSLAALASRASKTSGAGEKECTCVGDKRWRRTSTFCRSSCHAPRHRTWDAPHLHFLPEGTSNER
jgi:hypothetical protein